MDKAFVFTILLLAATGTAFGDARDMDPAPFPSPLPPAPILQQPQQQQFQPAPAPPTLRPPAVAHVELRASTHGCPARGSQWTEELIATSPVVLLDCPVGVTYKTWGSGRRVHVGIPTTVALHPGKMLSGTAVEYVLVAPGFR